MGFNGANFVFRGTGARSPFGSGFVSGSHCNNRQFWTGFGGSHSSRVNIDIRNYGAGGCYGGGGIFGAGYGGYYGGCGGGGISEKSALTALGIGAGIGLLASPLGGPILRGIGTGFKYIGKGISWVGKGIGNAASWAWNKAIKPAATWTYDKILKPVGKAIWSGVKAVGTGIGNFFKGCWNWITGKGWNGDK